MRRLNGENEPDWIRLIGGFTMRLKRRTVLAGVVLSLVAVFGWANPALAAGYTLVQGSATYIGGARMISPTTWFDDINIALSTTSPEPYRLPFPIRLAGVTSNTLYVNSNGVVSTNSASTAWTNTCLPSPVVGRGVAVYWDDLLFDRPTFGVDGIWTRTYGTAPARKFLVTYTGRTYANATSTVRAEVIFTERSSTVETRYAQGNGRTATIGIQHSSTGPFLQYKCNPPSAVTPAGKSLLFRWNP